jgi:predicted Zn-dependent peptidase
MTRLAKMEVYLGRYFTLDEVLKDINSVNTEDVLEMSNKILNEDDLQITILKPLSNKI